MMKRKIVSLFFIIMMITGLFVLTGCVSKESNYLKENADRIVSGSIEKDRNTNFDTLYEHDFTENEIKEIITQFKNCKLNTKKITEKNWEKIEEKLNENGKLNWHANFCDSNGTFIMEFIFDENFKEVYLCTSEDNVSVSAWDVKEDESIKKILKGFTEKVTESNLNDYARISIGDNGSTMNHSTYIIKDEEIIKYKYSEREDDSKYKNTEGYTLNVDYYFEGIKEGKTEIWVIDMFPGEIHSTIKYEISVDSNLKAKIVNSSQKYTRIKCAVLDNSTEKTQIYIDDVSVARNVNIWRWPNEISIVGLKQGTTTMTVKENDGIEKKYTVKVDANLNVELEEK